MFSCCPISCWHVVVQVWQRNIPAVLGGTLAHTLTHPGTAVRGWTRISGERESAENESTHLCSIWFAGYCHFKITAANPELSSPLNEIWIQLAVFLNRSLDWFHVSLVLLTDQLGAKPDWTAKWQDIDKIIKSRFKCSVTLYNLCLSFRLCITTPVEVELVSGTASSDSSTWQQEIILLLRSVLLPNLCQAWIMFPFSLYEFHSRKLLF